jgi:hypothetical protein
MLGPLTRVCYPERKKSHERRVMVHFGNTPIHNTEEIQEHSTNLGLKRMEHPPYSPGLALCDFCLFGAMKENFSGQRFESVDELFFAVEAFLEGFLLISCERFFGNGNDDYGYAVKSEENILSKQDKTMYFFLR